MKTLRAVLAVTVAVSSLLIFLYFGWKYSYTPDQIRLIQYDEYKLLVGQMVLGDFGRFFDFGVLLLAGICGLGIVRKDERLNKEDWPGIVLFLCSAIFLLLDICFSFNLVRSVENLYWTMPPDKKQFFDFFKSPYFVLKYDLVTYSFWAGLIISAIFVISHCMLRRSESK